MNFWGLIKTHEEFSFLIINGGVRINATMRTYLYIFLYCYTKMCINISKCANICIFSNFKVFFMMD